MRGLWGRRPRDLEQGAQSLMGSFSSSFGRGTVYRYGPDAVREAFANFFERLKAEVDGEPDPGAHPFVEALRKARQGELERLVKKEGSLLEMMLVEDAVFRGERERGVEPGLPSST